MDLPHHFHFHRSDINRSELTHLKCVYGLAGWFGFVLTWVGLCTWGKAGGRWGQGWMAGVGLSKRRSRRRGVGQGSSSLAPLLQKKKEEKKLLMVLLHDWAFVRAIVLPATSARDTVVWASQLAINHSRLTITEEAASSPSDWFVFSSGPDLEKVSAYFGLRLCHEDCYKEKWRILFGSHLTLSTAHQ